MPGITVAVVGGRDVAKELGKKGTTSDMTLFNHVRDGHAATVVEPTQYPEKLPPLLFALGMADRAIFAVPSLTREIAETATALDLSDVPVRMVLGAVGVDEVRRALAGMRFVHEPTAPLDTSQLRNEIDSWECAPQTGPTRVAIDHAFPVKGVGAVALGVVRGGPLHAHDRLRLFPTEREVELKSIQVHDVEVKEAVTGDRVGLALRSIEADELSRGQTLGPPGSLSTGTVLSGTAFRKCPYYRGTLGSGAQLQIAIGLQCVPALVEFGPGQSVRMTADRPVAFAPGDTALLADLSATAGSRMVGRATLSAPR
jgi:selenocysteine-specific translation elongation factor